MKLLDIARSHPGQLLFIAASLLLWSIANYGTVTDLLPGVLARSPKSALRWRATVLVRGLAAGVAVLFVGGYRAAWPIGLIVTGSSIALPMLRRSSSLARTAEVEIASIVLTWSAVVAVSVQRGVGLAWSLAFSRFPENDLASVCLVSAVVLFTFRGGTHIVRGLLEKCGSVIMAVGATSQATEIQRGRWIGNLERALLLAIIADGSYPAIAFLIAAKGLIRSKELENRDFAEYFLVGTLASIAVALAAGILIRGIIASFWT
ncbi:MAG TPA: hypothetical protein VG498_15545 [Terriglobales bacterium]|nr:hypothetical protein [Terriglobales bacterium]